MSAVLCVANTGLELTHSGIIRFLENEGFSSADTEGLGVHLNIPWPIMKTLEKDNVRNSKVMFYKVIDIWLNLMEPTSEKLAEALDGCGYPRISKKLRSKLSNILI